jgi:general secretion pathway protein K
MRLGEIVASERSMLRRNNMTVTTIWRERGDWGMPEAPAQ